MIESVLCVSDYSGPVDEMDEVPKILSIYENKFGTGASFDCDGQCCVQINPVWPLLSSDIHLHHQNWQETK